MNKRQCYVGLLVLLAVVCVGRAQAEKVYTIGVVPQFDARKIVKIWQPILDEVGKRADVRLRLQSSSDIPSFENEILSGEFDFAYMNPYHAIVANKNQGYLPLLRDVGRELYGILVVKKDSPIQSVTELADRVIAFPSPNALGATLLPRAELAKKFDIKVNELYVKSHGSVYLNVALGSAVAGGGVQKTLSQQPEKVRNELRVLHKTIKVSPHPIAVHPRVPLAIQEKIRDTFVELGNSEEGRRLLQKIPMKKIGSASTTDYEPLRKMGLEKYYKGK